MLKNCKQNKVLKYFFKISPMPDRKGLFYRKVSRIMSPILLQGLLFLIMVAFTACQPSKNGNLSTNKPTSRSNRLPKNIILMIGDGMGISQISANLYNNNNRSALEKFPVIGLQKSHSANNLVTDSGAAATAIGCGQKTYNHAIGLTKDSLPCPSIIALAHEKGLATGIVVTSPITHATPAAFVAHQKQRVYYEAIAKDVAQSNLDIFIGGGERYFIRRETDDLNLLKQLSKNGFTLKENLAGKWKPENKYAFFVAYDKPEPAIDGRSYLPRAASRTAQYLSERSPEGFFLMIEGSQIDWACHAGSAPKLLAELKDFDRTITAIYDFARKNGETLVIVTGDHESGGVSIDNGSKINHLNISFSSNGHTAELVPVFAYGPGAEVFRGVYDNTDIYWKMVRVLE